ncbi:uncharacterized protein LOC113283153 [Papaver somniferum]|uniref:uncharacterized protein LOC113283153 n=1 Tax=Papaver somniferum TaxID=3469 RepID=UPI000E6F5134|nr:uncharacterized protein LOC113283153 [Papaver somniferum]XP_026388103.1 uncharacterized protein LOC113283153 [Papaver somniferum]XP_026388104.1 uncharacterized protein LOC113283153 [Papaver somniferum]XP_026388105.1 uncharacterized protein LOC113283153 [Papaver somniferum]XP_026388107.1 uncharacterized protein LOC113283153 [Papaver somniferum]
MSNMEKIARSTPTKKIKVLNKRTKTMQQDMAELAGSVKTIAKAIEKPNKSSHEVDVRRFKKSLGNDFIFHGTEEPTDAEKWLLGIKKELKVMLVSEEDKVRFVTYMFHGDADFWWSSIERMENVSRMSWERFEELFLEKYFPPTAQAAKCMEFALLEQGDMSVTQLDKKFAELERHGQHLVPTQELRARKLECALKGPIRDRVVSHNHNTYAAVLKSALAVEASWDKTLKERESREKKKKVKQNPQARHKRPRTESPVNKEKKSGTECYNCREEGHYARDCPHPQRQRPQNTNHPRNQNVGNRPQNQPHSQNVGGRPHNQPRTNAPPFQPRQPNVQGKLNYVAEVRGEAENSVIEEFESGLRQ